MTIAVATYRSCAFGDEQQVLTIELPENRLTPMAVASYLRFGGRISDRVLDHFSWEGAIYGAMGDPIDPS